MKKIKIKDQYRNIAIRSGDINEEERTVDVSFSSEQPVERYFGLEVLDHNEKSVDLSRLNNGAAVLEDHQGSQIGVVEKAVISAKKGLATLKFSKNGRGAEIFEDIKDGIRRNISFGYQLSDLTREEDNSDIPVYRSLSWMPFEISVVGVPADATIGVGRSKDKEVEIEVDELFRDLSKPLIIEPEEKKEFCRMQKNRLKLKGISV